MWGSSISILGLTLVAAALATALALEAPAAAEEKADEKMVAAGKLRVAGRAMRCGRTPTLISRKFWDYGGATKGLIILNPRKLATIPKAVRLYVYAHECGHQVYGASEIKADCYAVRRGRRAGWLTRKGLAQICHFFKDQPGDYVHPPGPQRCKMMTQCFNDVRPRRADSGGRG